MLESKGDPQIVQAIISSLRAWQACQPYEVIPQEYKNIVSLAITSQSHLGWDMLFFGVWDQHWCEAQQLYLSTINSTKSATLWLAKVQRKLWLIAWTMWEHRNKIYHDVHKSITPNKRIVAITEMIITESQIGLNTLSQSLSHLFVVGDTQTKLAWSIDMQVQWLTSV
jgi:hypothetical protein